MDPNDLDEFVDEAGLQARFALIAAAELDRPTADDRFWYAAQGFLVATANVSRLLWPTQGNAERGAELRAVFEVDDDSPLKLRRMRDHFEHFDERLDEWIATDYRRVRVDRSIETIHPLDLRGAHRNFDPASDALTFRGESLELGPVVSALGVIRERARIRREYE